MMTYTLHSKRWVFAQSFLMLRIKSRKTWNSLNFKGNIHQNFMFCTNWFKRLPLLNWIPTDKLSFRGSQTAIQAILSLGFYDPEKFSVLIIMRFLESTVFLTGEKIFQGYICGLISWNESIMWEYLCPMWICKKGSSLWKASQ